MTITASMVKELRERTGAGMMECKKALEESTGDMEAAIVLMRKRGQAKAAKRAGKVAAEGTIVIAISNDKKRAYIAEVNCETDFVGRDVNFKAFAQAVAENGLKSGSEDIEHLLTLPMIGNAQSLEQHRQELITKIGENIQVRRVAYLESKGTIGHYNHGDRIGALVSLDKDDSSLAKDLAMHIAAANPQAIDEAGLGSDVLAKEKEIYMAQAQESGKPKEILEKMVTGRLAKFMQEVCLVGQSFIKNPEQNVGQLLKQHAAKVENFVRYEVGEGIEKEVVDFAEEVKAQVQGS